MNKTNVLEKDYVITEHDKKHYKKQIRKFRKKLEAIRKLRDRAVKFMNLAPQFDHPSQVEGNQKYYRKKIAQLDKEENEIVTKRKEFKKDMKNKKIREAIKFDKEFLQRIL